jgi:hypothetical protein
LIIGLLKAAFVTKFAICQEKAGKDKRVVVFPKQI